ncbi:hypothetical protein TYRP_022232 [Tyrophagus putrescentiae]|nr:hypothetical protein TYRP_022232 [Tyrophagus putrescentiae]
MKPTVCYVQLTVTAFTTTLLTDQLDNLHQLTSDHASALFKLNNIGGCRLQAIADNTCPPVT